MTPLIGGGRLLAFVAVHTVKYRNLLRDPRYALHAVLGESDEEFLVTGRAVVSDDWASRMAAAVEARRIGMTSRDDVLFEFYIERAHWAVWRGWERRTSAAGRRAGARADSPCRRARRRV
jgi:hypothetical protein